jgi:hypothetical protein
MLKHILYFNHHMEPPHSYTSCLHILFVVEVYDGSHMFTHSYFMMGPLSFRGDVTCFGRGHMLVYGLYAEPSHLLRLTDGVSHFLFIQSHHIHSP